MRYMVVFFERINVRNPEDGSNRWQERKLGAFEARDRADASRIASAMGGAFEDRQDWNRAIRYTEICVEFHTHGTRGHQKVTLSTGQLEQLLDEYTASEPPAKLAAE